MGTVGGLGGMQRGIGFWFCRCYRTAKRAKTEFSDDVTLQVWFCQCYRNGLNLSQGCHYKKWEARLSQRLVSTRSRSRIGDVTPLLCDRVGHAWSWTKRRGTIKISGAHYFFWSTFSSMGTALLLIRLVVRLLRHKQTNQQANVVQLPQFLPPHHKTVPCCTTTETSAVVTIFSNNTSMGIGDCPGMLLGTLGPSTLDAGATVPSSRRFVHESPYRFHQQYSWNDPGRNETKPQEQPLDEYSTGTNTIRILVIRMELYHTSVRQHCT